MAQTNSVLSEQEIITLVEAKAREGSSWYDSRLSRERMRVLEYYNGVLPRRYSAGSSSYISTDVYDSVEMLKAQLLEVFAGDDEIAQFDPVPGMTLEDCREATEACRYVIFHENRGFKIFNDTIHDGLTARVGVAKVYWEELFDYEDEEFSNLPYEVAQALASQDNVDEFDADLNEETQLFDGKLVRKIDKSHVQIDVIAPEEFLIEPRAITIDNATYQSHRTLKTKAELIKMGFDPKKVELVHYDDSMGLDLSPEVLARNEPVETYQWLNNAIQPELEKVMLYESYVKMVIDKKKGVRQYKICHTNDVLFEYEEVEHCPFLEYVPLPVPHIFYGNNYAARVVPYQNARTALTRAILDHSLITTNPRWAVVKGGLINPREMIDNRLGGIVNVARPDSVAALQVPNLNPFVLQVMQELKQDKEQSTGISELSQGLNKDAISQQNSAALVDNMVQLSGIRQKIAARNFAHFFQRLMLETMRLLVLNAKQTKMVQVVGQWKQVDPQAWQCPKSCSISMHLGYGEKDQHLNKLVNLYKELAQDPALQTMFDAQGRYNLIMDAGKVGGITNISAYVKDPSKAPPPKPDPIKMQEAQTKDKQASAQLLAAQSQAQLNQAKEHDEDIKLHQAQQKIMLNALDHDRRETRQDAETAARIDVAQREMRLEERMRPKEVSLKANVSPRP